MAKKKSETKKPIPRNWALVLTETDASSLDDVKHKVEYVWTSRIPDSINAICASVEMIYQKVRELEKKSPEPGRSGIESL